MTGATLLASLVLTVAAQQAPQPTPRPTVESAVRILGRLAGTCRFDLEVTSLRGLRPERCADPRALAILREAALQRRGEGPLAPFAELERAVDQLAAGTAQRVAYRVAVSPGVRMHARTGLDRLDIPVVLKTRHYDLVYDAAAALLDIRTHAHFPEVFEMQTVLKPMPLLHASLELWLRSEWLTLATDRALDGRPLHTFLIRHPQVPEFELCTEAATQRPVACWFRQSEGAVTHGRVTFDASAEPWPRQTLQITCANDSTDVDRMVVSNLETTTGTDDFRFAIAPGTTLRDSRTSQVLEFGSEPTTWPTEFGQWLEEPLEPAWRPGVMTGIAALLLVVGLLALARRR